MRVLLLLPAAGYANQDFQQAADKLGVEVITCADYCHQLAPEWGLSPLMSVAFDQPEISVGRILEMLPPPLGEGWGEGEGASGMPKPFPLPNPPPQAGEGINLLPNPRPHPNPDKTTSHSTKPASGQVAGYLPEGEGANVLPAKRSPPKPFPQAEGVKTEGATSCALPPPPLGEGWGEGKRVNVLPNPRPHPNPLPKGEGANVVSTERLSPKPSPQAEGAKTAGSVSCAMLPPPLGEGWGEGKRVNVLPKPRPRPNPLPEDEGANVKPKPIDAVLASDDHGVALAAHLRAALGLPGNSTEAVMRLRDKLHFRELQQAHDLPHPPFAAIAQQDDGEAAAAALGFPLVVKSRQLNASRGVIRADSLDQFKRALAQVRRIQARQLRDADTLGVLIERFIPGVEVALEGVLRAGELQVLALFGKPDPLDGPTFEETIYVTPSRLPDRTQRAIADAVSRACAAAEITDGVIHAEARINDAGVWLLEIAPRAIGGLCGRILEATLGVGSAEIVLRHALNLPLNLQTQAGAAGVMMIPIPANGMLLAVDGIEAARATPGITGIDITAAIGQLIAPPPEGASYLGFIFSRAATPADAEAALRAAHAKLAIHIQALI